MTITTSWAARWPLLALVALGLGLSGCFSNKPRVQALPPAQTAPVQTAELPPPAVPEPDAPISDEPLPGETQVASVPAEASALEIGRTDLLGGWAVSSGGDTCQLFMSLTTWTGGYRASTRGCNSPELSGISSWDLSGKTVTLKGGDGAAPVASLVATDAQTFNGATSQGSAITVSR
ncbi:MAG: AprI/Inh family metalloprotease inhibitor [Pseudomonadota bacterium]